MSWWVAGATVVGGLIGADASSKASKSQVEASRESTAAQERMFNRQTELQEPFRQAGLTSQNRLMELLGLGSGKTRDQYRQELLPQFTSKNAMQIPDLTGAQGIFKGLGPLSQAINSATTVDEAALNAEIDRRIAASGNSPDYGKYARDFGMADFQEDPGYAFRLKEGQKALDAQAAARGGLISGSALKAATRYGQDMGSQEFMNAYNRYQTNRSNQLNPLQSLAGVGQTATNTLTGAAGNLGAAQGANAINAGNARASGYVGQANAVNQGLNSYLNYSQNQNLLNSLNRNRSGGGGSTINYYGNSGGYENLEF